MSEKCFTEEYRDESLRMRSGTRSRLSFRVSHMGLISFVKVLSIYERNNTVNKPELGERSILMSSYPSKKGIGFLCINEILGAISTRPRLRK
jgi:hypothetical protein